MSSVQRTSNANSNQTYSFTYDALSNTTSLKVGGQTLATYTYQIGTGLLLTQTYANGDNVSFTYDNLGRTKTATYSDGRVLTYAYDGEGRLYSATETGNGATETYLYTYDSIGRLIYSEQKEGYSSVLRTNQNYNAFNQLTKQSWQLGSTAYSETYTYNASDGSLNTMTTGVGNTLTMGYDGLRRLTSVTGGPVSRQYTYRDIDSAKTTMQVASVTSGGQQYGYTYDSMGNIATYSAPGKGTITYTYDNQGQLLKATGDTTYTYTYDGAGNILTASDGTTTHTYTYGDADWKDLLTGYDRRAITYDSIGNPTSYYNGTRWNFTWVNGRTLASASDGANSLTYTYDANGLRTSKTANGIMQVYNYDNYVSGKLLRMLCGTFLENNIDFFYDASGAPYAMRYNGIAYYYITNLQGDVMSLVDASGNVVASYEYDPYGKVLSATGPLADANPLRYRGYVYDQETGFYYVSSRYYDPEIGRFINADDIGYLGAGSNLSGYNLFAYCGNNPVTGYDPAGTLDWGNLFKGSGWFAVGVTAIAVGVSVLTCGVAAPAIMAVATVTVAAGAATAVNGVSELGEVATGHNFMRDDVFRGNAKAYNTYAHTTAAVAEIGTMVCGGWLKANAPRIEAYNNVQNYTYADGAAKHVGERSYYDSTLLKKEIIKYGTMANEGGGVYTFRVAGTAFSNVRQTFQSGIWELTTIDGKGLIGHFLLRS